MALDDVHVPLEHEATPAGCNDADFIAWLQPGVLQGLYRDGRLMLCADAREAPASFPYFFIGSKGSGTQRGRQRAAAAR